MKNPMAQDKWVAIVVSLTFFAVALLAFTTGQAPESWLVRAEADKSLNAKAVLFGAFVCCLGFCPLAAFISNARQAVGWVCIWAMCAFLIYVVRG